MSIVVDTNVLLRRHEPEHAHFHVVMSAVRQLLETREILHVADAEPRRVLGHGDSATKSNGLGLDVPAALANLARIEQTFRLLPDDRALYEELHRLIEEHHAGARCWAHP